jgi:regulator of protease activity HflC (stomatin/prohibitin superfamily)
MFGIRYMKAGPNQYVIHYQNGRVRRAGTSLAFFYYQPAASISVVPVSSADAPFIFNETTADFQPVTVQGQLTYRVADPELVAGLLDYRVDGSIDRYLSEDPEKLPQRLVNLAQILVRSQLQGLPLRQSMHASDDIARAIFDRMAQDGTAASLGVEVLALTIQAIRPTPEIARALEAGAREDLLKTADLAIYDRRNAAVEQERRIKENELETEIAVEDKKRQIRERVVEADLAVEARQQQVRLATLAGQIQLEDERKRLVAARTDNARAEADAHSYALRVSLHPLTELDHDLLQMLAFQSMEPRRMVSLALKEIAQNAARIGNLNISPDLLENLLREDDGRRSTAA